MGFLCGKVSNYLDRVYADERILHPLVRRGPKGEGSFERVSWDEALDRVAGGLTRVRDEYGGEAILPYSYMGTQGLIQGNLMSARVMNALGATELERTICATAGIAGTVMAHGISPEVDPEEWPHARYVLVWGWNPMSTAPHLWRKLLDARKAGARLVVVDPFRSRTARVADEHLRPLPGTDAALGMGMMRAIVDAGLQDEDWCRAHADGYDELLAKLADFPVERAAEISGVDAETIARVGREFASTRRRCCGSAWARSVTSARPRPTRRSPRCRHSPAPGASAAAAARTSRPRPPRPCPSTRCRATELRPGPVRTINMSQVGAALTDESLDPPLKALVCWNSNPAAIAPDQEQVLAGLRREDLFTVVLEQFMTDTAAHADVVLPATTQLEHRDIVFSWGHHYLTWNEPAIEPLGEAKPNTETFRLIAERLGFDDPLFRETDDELDRPAARGLRGGRPARARLDEDRPRPGAGAARRRRLRHRVRQGDRCAPTTWRRPRSRDEALAERFPLALVTPKTHLFLNSTFANQRRQHSAQPRPEVVVSPEDAGARRIEDGAAVRVWNDRGAFTCAARVSDDARPGVLVAPMGWWNRDYERGRSAQATTSQRLTELGNAPTFNDNRVEIEPLSE